jgi:CspA family cold shock protein
VLYGRVTEFDDARGLGSITSDEGTTFDFHCIEIADGTRTIEPDQRVAFERLARFGRFQARTINKV